VLLVHIWAAILVFMRALLSKWLIAENLLRMSLLSHSLGALANVFLNYYLIPPHGPVGAAYATVLSYFFAGYLVLFCNRRLLPMALVVNRSFLLPFRVLRRGFKLYEVP
jgi:PST family polysaccharide transporter